MHLKTDTSIVNLKKISTINTEVKLHSVAAKGHYYNRYIVLVWFDDLYYVPSTITSSAEEVEQLRKAVINEIMLKMKSEADFIELKRFPLAYVEADNTVYAFMEECVLADLKRQEDEGTT